MNRRHFISAAVTTSFYTGLHPIFAQDHSADNSGQIRQWRGQPIPVKNRKQLFIDEKFIHRSKGIQLTVNPPVDTKELEFESVANMSDPGVFSTVLEIENEYWLFYHSYPTQFEEKGPESRMLCVSRSKDGIHWQPERVNRFDVPGAKQNNVVIPGAIGTVFIDPKKSQGSKFWYIGIMKERTKPPVWKGSRNTYYHTLFDDEGHYYHEGGVYLAHSKDGLYWERLPGVALPFWCDTQNQAFYDERIQKYVAYLRGNNPPGMPKRRNVRRVVTDQLDQAPWPYDENPNRNRGPNGLYGDLIDELKEVMGPDGLDPEGTDLYNPCVNPYPWAEDIYFSFPSVYRHYDGENSYGRDLRGKKGNQGPLDVQVAVSRDGIDFHRYRTPYLSPGLLENQHGGGTLYMGVGLIKRGNYIYHYYKDTAFPHGSATFPNRESVKDRPLRVAIQRLDGFVSADAGPMGGELITPPITFQGNRLLLNIDCGAMGEAWVQIQDPHGRPIPGYRMDQAVSVDRNGIAQQVWWKDGPDVSSLSGKPVRLNIKMRSAKLYAFRFSG